MLKAPTAEVYVTSLRWANVPVALLMVALAGFAYHYLEAGLRWLAVTAIGLRLVSLVVNFTVGESLEFLHVTSLRSAALLGEQVATAAGVRNPWQAIGQIGVFLNDAVLHCRFGARVAARSACRRRCLSAAASPSSWWRAWLRPCVMLLAGRQPAQHRQRLFALRRRRRHRLRAERRPVARQAARRRAQRAGRARSSWQPTRPIFGTWTRDNLRDSLLGEQEIARAVRIRARGASQRRAVARSGFMPTIGGRPLGRASEPGGAPARRLPERVSRACCPMARSAGSQRSGRVEFDAQGPRDAKPGRLHGQHRAEGVRAGDPSTCGRR